MRGWWLSVVLLATVAAGCGDSGAKVSRDSKAAVAENYADIVLAAYGAAIDSATRMDDAIERFVDRPTTARLAGARRAWIAARDDYVATEAFRFYGGPIDAREGRMNAWPMDEAYVDYVRGDRDAGIVNDRRGHPTITQATIVAANEQGGETNISSGWHAIEFLLWGQDRSRTGPGRRPVSDYTTAANADRRATYLRLASARLLSDLAAVRARWTAGDGTYRGAFLADPDKALTKILRGVGALNSGELVGERMAVAFESKDQEDEHSCFSDNTNADVVNDIRAIRMVYEGRFGTIAGPSLADLVREVDPKLAAGLQRQIAATLGKATAFPATFETMIAAPNGSAESRALAGVISALEAQGADLARAAKELGVTVNFEA
ncbi:MAG TPA: imelysin family protein [Solirubrobacteraceae bacterium]|nr:imelysin family protein [Solirubrobacteraceae bacterium]